MNVKPIMIIELKIKNIAIIDKLHICFKQGLSVLSGETGAGKSIIIDVLSLICGSRASTELIRTGEDEAVVEAMFQVDDDPQINNLLQESGIDFDQVLLVKRCLSRSGKNRIYINGSMATLALLGELGNRLITIHGQHDSQALLRPDQHLALLDAFAGTTQDRGKFAAMYLKLQRISTTLADFKVKEQEAARRIDILDYQIHEISSAEIRVGEDEQLEHELKLLLNVDRLGRSACFAFEALYSNDQAILTELRRVSDTVAGMVTIDENVAPLNTLIEESYLQLEDAALQLRDYLARLESDPLRLQQVEERLDLLLRLKRKYAPTLEEIISLNETFTEELEVLKGIGSGRFGLEQELAGLQTEMESLGKALGDTRRNAALKLEQLLVAEVRQLAMPNAVVQVAFEELPEPRGSGYEKVEFLFSPNPGEIPRPLAKVASGGELSRLMLAFRQILPDGGAPTMVFDEVDSGIGGAVANLVGRKLRNLANNQQIFCITHLPQVAAYGEQHLFVEKFVENSRTVTCVRELAGEEVVDEIARMLAGQQLTDAARDHAAELISQAIK